MGGRTSAASKNKWMAKAYDRVNLTMPKGQKAEIQVHAQARGESVNGFINRAIQETMERDNDVLGPSEGRREGNEGGVPNE